MALEDMMNAPITALPRDANEMDGDTLTSIVSPDRFGGGFQDTFGDIQPPQPTIPAQQVAWRGPIQGLTEGPIEDHVSAASSHTVGPQSEPLISAISNGYADKKYMKPIESIREGLKLGDLDLVQKGHKGLTDLLLGDRSFSDVYKDLYYNHGQQEMHAKQMAGDVVMKEIQQHYGIGMPGVEDTVRLGLIKPNELLPGSQLANPGIPGQQFPYGSDGGDGMAAVQTQGIEPQYVPGARLTPQQDATATSRQHGLSTGTAYRMANSTAQADLAREKAETERYKRTNELPLKMAAQRSLDMLREKQGQLIDARANYTRQLPALREKLQGNSNPFELEAMKRVHAAIKAQEPIEPADWLVAKRYLFKGNPEFGLDFVGNTYSKQTGESSKTNGGVFKGMSIPVPPDTSLAPHEHAEVEAIGDDFTHQVGQMLGSLLSGITGPKEGTEDTKKPTTKSSTTPSAKAPTKAPEVKLPTPKTPEAAMALKPGTKYLRPDGKMMVR